MLYIAIDGTGVPVVPAAAAERAGKADAQGLIEEVVHALGNLPSADLDLEEVAVRAIRRAV
jgi:hypothetical protein